MKTSKLKYLAIALFLNNVKSVHLQPAQNIAVYTYKDQNENTHISSLEFIINQDRFEMFKDIVAKASKEIAEASQQYNNYTMTFHNSAINFDKTYRVTKNNEIIKITTTPDPDIETLDWPNMNYSILALLYINSKNMKNFFIDRANQNPNRQNEHVYLIDKLTYLVIQDPDTYYIFAATLRAAMENHPNIGQLLRTRNEVRQNEIIQLFDRRQINWNRIIAAIATCAVITCGILYIIK